MDAVQPWVVCGKTEAGDHRGKGTGGEEKKGKGGREVGVQRREGMEGKGREGS